MVGVILRKLRLDAGLTQEKLGHAAFVSKSAISQYERGKSRPSRATLEALAKYFNVTTDYLLGTSDNPTLEETMNQKYHGKFSVSYLLKKCMGIPAEKREAFLVVVEALSTSNNDDKRI
jgi:transcriptional regulator with XRE-family HTH domain